MTFRDLQEFSKISPNTIRPHLAELIKRKLVLEEGREEWRLGKKLWYHLTSSGEKYVMNKIANKTLEEAVSLLKRVSDLTKLLANDPERIADLRRAMNEPSVTQDEIRQNSDEDLIDLFDKRQKKKYGLLKESLKTIYSIFMNVEVRPGMGEHFKDGFVFGIDKKGGVYLIPITSLKKRGLGIGL